MEPIDGSGWRSRYVRWDMIGCRILDVGCGMLDIEDSQPEVHDMTARRSSNLTQINKWP